jgi:hypothetical protein
MVKAKDFLEKIWADTYPFKDLVFDCLDSVFPPNRGETGLTLDRYREDVQGGSGIHIELSCHQNYEATEEWGEGRIHWQTSSGHQIIVRLRWKEGWMVEKVIVGNDPSENLYPLIRAISQEFDIPVGVFGE